MSNRGPSSDELINDSWLSRKYISFRWVLLSIGVALGCVGTVVFGSFTIGSKVTELGMATTNTDKRVDALESSYAEDRKLLYRIDGKLDTLLSREAPTK